jgi:hypothetical protein
LHEIDKKSKANNELQRIINMTERDIKNLEINNKYLDNSKRQAHKNKREFSMEKMKEVINTYLDLIPKQQALKLPTLKKIELPKLKAL